MAESGHSHMVITRPGHDLLWEVPGSIEMSTRTELGKSLISGEAITCCQY